MNKLKIFLTILSIAITVVPLMTVVYIYRDNLIGLVAPPELMSLTNGDGGNSVGSSILNPDTPFEPPQSVGEPTYDPNTRTATFTFNFTNPLKTPISIGELSAGINVHEDGFHLGDVNISQPVTFKPGQTELITAYGVLSSDAINYLKTQHAGASYINVDFTNLNLEVSGIKIQIDQQNVGNIPIPPGFLG
jgi:hypothetical protein